MGNLPVGSSTKIEGKKNQYIDLYNQICLIASTHYFSDNLEFHTFNC